MSDSLPIVSLVVEYDGTQYVGWQLQPNGPSIQGEIERALAELCGKPIRVTASGRTDSGVHALGQVVSFEPGVERPERAYQHGLNRLLPADIAVREVRFHPLGFNARRSARGKIYRYQIQNVPTRSPLTSRYSWQVYQPLDVDVMREAARTLLGTHDFNAFRASNCEAKTTVRTLRRLDVTGQSGGTITIEAEATAFLKHMVRNFVGTLVEVGLGKRKVSSVAEALASKDRKQAGATAPPQGLCLMKVHYPEANASAGAGVAREKSAESDADDDADSDD
jgi:tRNA pseudouridine38-40 synthase